MGAKLGSSLGTCLCPFSVSTGRDSRAWREAIVQMGRLRHGEGKECPGGMEGRSPSCEQM